MADFYPVLSRAIAGLPDQSPEARRAIYDRAAHVLVTQLRNIDPPVAETEITRQRLQLEEVIARIEREHAARLAQEAAAADEEAPSFAPADQAAAVPVRPAPERAPNRPSFASLVEPDRQGDQPGAGSVVERVAERVPEPEPVFEREPQRVEAAAAPDRPRLDFATNQRPRKRSMRSLIVAGGVALGIGSIAAMAYYVNRDNLAPAPAVTAQQQPQPTAPAGGAKINERAGAEPAQPQPGAPTGQAQPAQPPAGAGQRGPEVAVAQRAVLYMEPADASQPPRAVPGRVTWRVEAQNAGQGQPLETVIRADVEVPDVGLSLVFTIRRNTDAAFPASHIVGLRFTRSADDGNGAVREAGVPQFKTEENERGAPLSAITTALGENLFVSALSRVPVEVERNVDLLRSRNWIDVPLRFASGKRGIIAFEKGLSGEQRMAEGFAAWR